MVKPTFVRAAALCLLAAAAPSSVQAQAFRSGETFSVYEGLARGSDVAFDYKNNVYLMVSANGVVYGRFITPTGELLSTCGAPIAIGAALGGHFPRVSYSPDVDGGKGGFLVTWHENVPGSTTSVHARTVSFNSCLGTDYVVSTGDGSFWENGPPSAYSPTAKKFLVVWQSYALGNVNGRLLDVTGAPQEPLLPIAASEALEREPSIAHNPATDRFYVVYGGWQGSSFVAGQMVTSAGALVGGPHTLGGGVGINMSDVVYNPASGTFLVGWWQGGAGSLGRVADGSTGAAISDVFALSTRFGTYDSLDIDYNPVSGTFFLVGHASYEDGGVELLNNGLPVDNGFIVTATDNRSGTFYPRIAANKNQRQWLMSTVFGFKATYGQFIGTNTTSKPGEPPPPPPPPPPGPGPKVVSLGSNRVFPVLVGSVAPWTAGATGGTAPLQYKFERWRPTTGWMLLRGFGTSNAISAGVSTGAQKIRVTVKSANPAEGEDSMETITFFGTPTTAMSFSGNHGAVLTYNAANGIATPYDASGMSFTPWGAEALVAGGTVHAGDFDGNGLTDFVVYNRNNGEFVRATNTGAGFVTTFATWATNWTITVLDLNGDGFSDVFRYNRTTGAYAKCFSSATADFACVPGTWAGGWTVTAADFNGDGMGDLFLFNNRAGDANAGRWVRVISHFNGTSTYLYGSIRWASDWTVTAGDFNGDNLSDLFLYRPSGQWFKVFFTPAGEVYVGGLWSGGWNIRPGDFNGDGRTDLFLYNSANGMWFVVTSMFDGQFSYQSGRWAANWQVSVTDLNGDTVSDVLLYNSGSGQWFKAVTILPAVFSFSSGFWSSGLWVAATRGEF